MLEGEPAAAMEVVHRETAGGAGAQVLREGDAGDHRINVSAVRTFPGRSQIEICGGLESNLRVWSTFSLSTLLQSCLLCQIPLFDRCSFLPFFFLLLFRSVMKSAICSVTSLTDVNRPPPSDPAKGHEK